MPKVTNFAKAFMTGGKYSISSLQQEVAANLCQSFLITTIELYQKFFNILYEENMDCKLVTTNTDEARALNWNRINASICFNYLQ